MVQKATQQVLIIQGINPSQDRQHMVRQTFTPLLIVRLVIIFKFKVILIAEIPNLDQSIQYLLRQQIPNQNLIQQRIFFPILLTLLLMIHNHLRSWFLQFIVWRFYAFMVLDTWNTFSLSLSIKVSELFLLIFLWRAIKRYV